MKANDSFWQPSSLSSSQELRSACLDAREIVESEPRDPVDEHEATSHHGHSDLGCQLAISQLFLVALPFFVLFVIIYQRLGLKCILLVCFLAPVLQLFLALIIKHEIFDLLRSFNVKYKVNEMQLKLRVQFQMHFQCQSVFHGLPTILISLSLFTWTSSRTDTRLL